MPHVPIFCSSEFEGKSGVGLYGDVTMELDWSVGEINKALKSNGLDDNTIVIFSSDNGPWVAYGNHAGSTPFREAKATSFDGGTRSACIIKYPKHLEANTSSNKAFFTIDLLPTLCHLTEVDLPETEIDGKNVTCGVGGFDYDYVVQAQEHYLNDSLAINVSVTTGGFVTVSFDMDNRSTITARFSRPWSVHFMPADLHRNFMSLFFITR